MATDTTTIMPYAQGRVTPFEQLGANVEGAMTAAEAMAKAGLDWEVKKGPIYGPRPPTQPDGTRPGLKPIPGRIAIYRTDTYAVLGVASPAFTPYQNAEAFDFMDGLVADRNIAYVGAGAYGGGKLVWIQARLDLDIRIAGEEWIPYIVMGNNHDGGGALRWGPTVIRVRCKNTLTAALASRGVMRFIHRPGLRTRMEEAKGMLKVTTEAMRNLGKWMELAQRQKLGPEVYDAVETELFGTLDEATPKQRRDKIDAFRAIYGAEVEANGPTAYSLVNAVTGYADHGKEYRQTETMADRRFYDTQEGNGFAMKRDVFGLLGQHVPALKVGG